MEIVGLFVCDDQKGRIQLMHDVENSRYVVRHMLTNGGVVSDARVFPYLDIRGRNVALIAAIALVAGRAKDALAGPVVYEDYTQFALILDPEGDVQMEGFTVYYGRSESAEDSLHIAEDAVREEGRFDITTLLYDINYASAVTSLLLGAEDTGPHTGVALLIM